MGREIKESGDKNLRLTMKELKGKQSVRATFKIPQQAIELLSVIAGQLGIQQKSLFDQLVENVSILEQVAHRKQDYKAEENDRRQKTFVISRRSLRSLNEIAKKEGISRDLLVEISIKRLLPVIGTELEKHKKRKELLIEMKEYLQRGKKALDKTESLLGKDDPVYEMIKKQVDLAEKNVAVLDGIVERGMAMEDW